MIRAVVVASILLFAAKTNGFTLDVTSTGAFGFTDAASITQVGASDLLGIFHGFEGAGTEAGFTVEGDDNLKPDPEWDGERSFEDLQPNDLEPAVDRRSSVPEPAKRATVELAPAYPAPEPATMMFIGCSLFGLAVYSKRRMSTA